MHSAIVDDEVALDESASVSNLLVLWQNPTDRRFVPIGRFTFDGALYSFAYTRAAAAVPSFRTLPGLPDLEQRYTSERIPAVFSQRVMSRSRSDFGDYARALGLDPANASPWEQIVHSGGTRAGDTLQFMQVPTVKGGRARARLFANGVKHIPNEAVTVGGRAITISAEQHERAIQNLTPGDRVWMLREDNNPADQWACLIAAVLPTSGSASATSGVEHSGRTVPLGWVPRILSEDIRSLLDECPVACSVLRVGQPGSPSHQRLVLDLDHPAPQDFRFDRRGNWEPVAEDWMQTFDRGGCT